MNHFQISIVNPAGDCEEFTVEEGIHVIGNDKDAGLCLSESFAWRGQFTLAVEAYGASLLGNGHFMDHGDEPVDEMTGTYHPYPVTLLFDHFEIRIDLVDPLRSLEDRLDATDSTASKIYDIGDQIGKGGMSTVYRAGDATLGRYVAMKVMQAKGADIRTARRRFLREAMVLGRLEHPNIVPIHDFGRDEQGRLFYTMKLVRGETLRSVLRRIREGDEAARLDFPLERLLNDFKKVCDAISFAHARGIIHRDLKPENVMIGEFGEVLVMDWGLAKILRAEETDDDQSVQKIEGFNEFTSDELADLSATLTVAGVVVGTPQYMSPEQATGNIADVNEKSDIFALGGILYSMLTLRPPVAGKSVGEVLRQLKSGHFTNPTHYNQTRPGTPRIVGTRVASDREATSEESFELPHLPQSRVPNALAAVAMRALSLDAEDRHPTTYQLKQDIEAYQGGYATSAEELTGWGHFVLLIRRNQILASASMIVALLSIVFVMQLVSSRNEAITESHNARVAEELARRRETNALNALLEAQLAHAQGALENADGSLLMSELSRVPESIRNHDWEYLWNRQDDSVDTLDFHTLGSTTRVAPADPGDLILVAMDSKLLALDSKGTTNRSFDAVLPPPLLFSTSADGTRIAIGSGKSGLCRILDWEHGEILQTIEFAAQDGDVAPDSVHLSPDGHLLLLRHQDSDGLSVYSVRNGWRLWSRQTTGPVEFHPRQPLLALQDRETLRLLRTDTGIEQDHITPSTHDFHINTRIRFSPDGQYFAASDNRGFLRIYQTRNRVRVAKFRPRDQVLNFAFTRDNRILTLGQQNREGLNSSYLELRELESGRKLHSFLGVSAHTRTFSFHPNTGHLITGDGPIKRWLVPTGLEYRILNSGTKNPSSLTFATENRLITPYQGRQVFLVDLQHNDAWRPLKMSDNPDHCIPIGNTLLVTSSMNGEVFGSFQLFSTERPYNRIHKRTHPHAIADLNIANDKQTIAASYQNGSLELLDAEDLTVVEKLTLPRGVALYPCFTAKDRVLACLLKPEAGEEDAIGLFSIKDASAFDSMAAPTSLTCLATLTQTGLLVAGDASGSINIFDAVTKKLLRRQRVHDQAVTAVAVYGDARFIATGSDDLTVKIWDSSERHLQWQAIGLTQSPTRIAFNPDASLLAAAQKDGTVRIWKLPAMDASPEAGAPPTIESAATVNSEIASNADSLDPTP